MMRYSLIFIISAILSCKNSIQQKPLWLNAAAFHYNTDTFYFKSKEKNCNVVLNSFTQPLPLLAKQVNDTLIVYFENTTEIINGPAHICLQVDDENYTYPIFLKNKITDTSIAKDYRSPKTINPDSSLVHQSIKFNIDSGRNIVPLQNGKLFDETNIAFAPTTKTYRAINNESITAFYVQSGSATKITISAAYNSSKKEYEIATSTIYDKHQNIVADGTNVTFTYANDLNQGETNTTTIAGIAKVILPKTFANNSNIVASIHQVKSNKLILK